MEHLSKFKLIQDYNSLPFIWIFIHHLYQGNKEVTKLGFVEYSCMPSGFKRKISSWFLWL